MRILYLLNALEPDGPGHLILEIASRLKARHGFDCRIAALSRSGTMREECERAGVPAQVLGSISALRSCLREQRPDVLHTNLLRADLIGRWLGHREGVPKIISTEHGIHTWDTSGRPLRPLIRAAWMHTARHAQAIVAVSEFVRRQLLAEGVPAPKIQLIRNGVDVQRFHPLTPGEKIESRRKFGFGLESCLVVAAGKLAPLKGHMTMLKAVQKILATHTNPTPPLEFAIAGDGPLFNDLQMFLRQQQLANCVRMMGHLSDDLPQFLGCADIVVQPSRMESFGLVAAQALSCAVPVIASDVGGLPELVEDGVTGRLVPPEDPTALAEVIVDLAANASPEMGTAGRRKIIERFDVEKTAQDYAALYGN